MNFTIQCQVNKDINFTFSATSFKKIKKVLILSNENGGKFHSFEQSRNKRGASPLCLYFTEGVLRRLTLVALGSCAEVQMEKH